MQSDPLSPVDTPAGGTPPDRGLLRSKLRAARETFVGGAAFARAESALAAQLLTVLGQLEPRCLGLYWAIRSEFNAVPACAADPGLSGLPWALPFTRRAQRQMQYHHWDGGPTAVSDESGLPSSDGAPVVPDVIVVPCLGYTAAGFRLGYGAGYFDRWLAAHPETTAVGVAWSVGLLSPTEFRPEAHDQPMMLVVTEQGVVGG